MNYKIEFMEFVLNVRNYSDATAVAYGCAIDDFEKTMGISDPGVVTTVDLDTYLGRKALAGLASSTRRMRIHALKSFFRFLRTRHFITHDPGVAVRPPVEKQGAISTLTEQEITRIIFDCPMPMAVRGEKEPDQIFLGRTRRRPATWARDSAMIGAGYVLGLRSEEVGRLKLDDYRIDGRGIPTVSVIGKWAKEPKMMRLDRRTAALVDEWLARRRELRVDSIALFPALSSVGLNKKELGISPFGFANALKRRILIAGIEIKSRRLSPHCLRYSRATHMYAKRIGLMEIQRHLRHRSIQTTIRYIRLGSGGALEKEAAGSVPWAELPRLPGSRHDPDDGLLLS